MRPVVAAQVDPLRRHVDAGEQCVRELVLGADEREHGAVVILVGMHVEEASSRADRVADRRDRRTVATLAEVRHRLEWQHAPYSRRR